MASDSLAPMSRKKTWRERDPLERILLDWYGKERAADEVMRHLPDAGHISAEIPKVMEKLAGKEVAFLEGVKAKWPDIAGPQIAQFATPSGFKKGVLYVEVLHPAWRSCLGKKEKQMLLEKITFAMQTDDCVEVVFSHSGSSPYRKTYKHKA